MKILFDTSVLVAAMVEAHPMHRNALHWLRSAKVGEFEFFVASHTLAELYSVLTTLPVKPKISPGTAWRLIHENVEKTAKIISLSASEYKSVIKYISDFGLAGGVVYDALIAKAANTCKVDRLLTLNIDDFKRVWPEGIDRISLP